MLRPYCEIIMSINPYKHTNYRIYSKFLKPYLDEKSGNTEFETICLVREPVSWLNSWYRFRSRPAIRDPNHVHHENCTHNISFEMFLEQYMAPAPPSYANVRSQYDFVKDDTGAIGVDTIFCYERIESFVAYMSGKIGIKLELGQLNISPKSNYALPAKLEERLRQYIPDDFDLYNQAVKAQSSRSPV